MHLNRNIIIDTIKVLCATVLLTAIILWWLEKTGEPLDQNFSEDYVNQPDTDISNSIATGSHDASTAISLKIVCENNAIICKKISFIGDFINEEKAKYIQQQKKITSFISDKNALKKDFLQSVSSIQINEIEGKRWYATRDKVVINIWNIYSDDEFHQISTHELWHIADLWFLQGTGTKKDKNYTEFKKAVFSINDPSVSFYKLSRDSESIRKASAKKQNFCSIYGMSDPFEDFAECFNLYINHNKLFKFLGQKDVVLGKKYNFLASMFKGSYINGDTASIIIAKNKPTERVRDTTKISLK